MLVQGFSRAPEHRKPQKFRPHYLLANELLVEAFAILVVELARGWGGLVTCFLNTSAYYYY